MSFFIAFACWGSGKAAYQLYQYSRLTVHVPAEVTKWSVEKIADDRFIPKASYQFTVDQKLFSNEYLYADHWALNPWGAEQVIKSLRDEKIQVWYSAKNPQISALQKQFPLKACFLAAMQIALVLYFLWLGYYVSNRAG